MGGFPLDVQLSSNMDMDSVRLPSLPADHGGRCVLTMFWAELCKAIVVILVFDEPFPIVAN
jgi:hypothetical protein